MEKGRDYYGQTYIEGNTVRRMEAAPDYRREREERRREEERKRREEAQKRNRRIAKRNQERAAHMNRGYVAFLSLAVILSGVVCALYINLQSDITNHMSEIAALESQVASLRADNDATEKRIETSMNLDVVKDVAMNQLGMGYASQDQIIHYTVDKEDYMNQYEDIPSR